MMEWYLKVFRQYADFGGRAGREEFWMFVLFNFLAVVALTIVDNLFGLTLKGVPYGALYCMYSVAAWSPALAVAVRRLHDSGKSGRWMWINLIPLAGQVWFLILMLAEGQPGVNPYGARPGVYDGFGAKRKNRSAAVALVFAAGLWFAVFLNGTLSLWLQQNAPGNHMIVWITQILLPCIIPVTALLLAGIALLREKDGTAVAATALLIASGILFLLSVYHVYGVVDMAEMLHEQGRYLLFLLFRLAWMILPVTFGIAGLALLQPGAKSGMLLRIAACLFLAVHAVQGIYHAAMAHGAHFYRDELPYEFARFFINHWTVVTPVAMLALAYALLPKKEKTVYVFELRDYDRMEPLSLSAAEMYAPDSLRATVRKRFSLPADQRTVLLSPGRWNAPAVTFHGNSCKMDGGDREMTARAAACLTALPECDGMNPMDIAEAVKNGRMIVAPNPGILLLCVTV
jgi:uncharacterized membrane protein YhaH (DUF805 family)